MVGMKKKEEAKKKPVDNGEEKEYTFSCNTQTNMPTHPETSPDTVIAGARTIPAVEKKKPQPNITERLANLGRNLWKSVASLADDAVTAWQGKVSETVKSEKRTTEEQPEVPVNKDNTSTDTFSSIDKQGGVEIPESIKKAFKERYTAEKSAVLEQIDAIISRLEKQMIPWVGEGEFITPEMKLGARQLKKSIEEFVEPYRGKSRSELGEIFLNKFGKNLDKIGMTASVEMLRMSQDTVEQLRKEYQNLAEGLPTNSQLMEEIAARASRLEKKDRKSSPQETEKNAVEPQSTAAETATSEKELTEIQSQISEQEGELSALRAKEKELKKEYEAAKRRNDIESIKRLNSLITGIQEQYGAGVVALRNMKKEKELLDGEESMLKQMFRVWDATGKQEQTIELEPANDQPVSQVEREKQDASLNSETFEVDIDFSPLDEKLTELDALKKNREHLRTLILRNDMTPDMAARVLSQWRERGVEIESKTKELQAFEKELLAEQQPRVAEKAVQSLRQPTLLSRAKIWFETTVEKVKNFFRPVLSQEEKKELNTKKISSEPSTPEQDLEKLSLAQAEQEGLRNMWLGATSQEEHERIMNKMRQNRSEIAALESSLDTVTQPEISTERAHLIALLQARIQELPLKTYLNADQAVRSSKALTWLKRNRWVVPAAIFVGSVVYAALSNQNLDTNTVAQPVQPLENPVGPVVIEPVSPGIDILPIPDVPQIPDNSIQIEPLPFLNKPGATFVDIGNINFHDHASSLAQGLEKGMRIVENGDFYRIEMHGNPSQLALDPEAELINNQLRFESGSPVIDIANEHLIVRTEGENGQLLNRLIPYSGEPIPRNSELGQLISSGDYRALGVATKVGETYHVLASKIQ